MASFEDIDISDIPRFLELKSSKVKKEKKNRQVDKDLLMFYFCQSRTLKIKQNQRKNIKKKEEENGAIILSSLLKEKTFNI